MKCDGDFAAMLGSIDPCLSFHETSGTPLALQQQDQRHKCSVGGSQRNMEAIEPSIAAKLVSYFTQHSLLLSQVVLAASTRVTKELPALLHQLP